MLLDSPRVSLRLTNRKIDEPSPRVSIYFGLFKAELSHRKDEIQVEYPLDFSLVLK